MVITTPIKTRKEMKKYLSILFGAAALVFAGCEQLENNAPEQATEGQGFTFEAGIGAATKVTYGESVDGKLKLTWNDSGEKVTVFFLNDANEVVGTETFTQKSVSADKKKAKFEGTIPGGATKLLSVYPAIGANESAAGFTYDFTTQTGDFNGDCTVMRTDEAISLADLQTGAKAATFDHWNYIINTTLDFGASVTGTVTDIVFNNPNIVSKKKYWIQADGTWKGQTTKGIVTVSESKTLADGKTNVVIYGFGTNPIYSSVITCKIGDKIYRGVLQSRLNGTSPANCNNSCVYNPVIEMKDVTNNTILEFDANKVPENWPTAATSEEKKLIFRDNYEFILSKGTYIAHSDGLGGTDYFRLPKKSGYLGLPIVAGKKLTAIEIYNVAAGTSNRQTVILNSEENEVSDTIVLQGQGGTYTFQLNAPQEGVCYISAKKTSGNFIGFPKITLFYE